MRSGARALLALLVALLALTAATTVNAAPTPIGVSCDPAPADCDAWYRGPVTVKWSLPSATDIQAGTCVLRTYTADTPGDAASCTAWQGSPGSGRSSATVVIRIDQTAPVVTGAPDRPPDFGGWFNHPLAVGFAATDVTSGVASCTRSGYGGPDIFGATVTGTCTDVAGNVGTGTLAVAYDSTAPAPPKVDATPADNAVDLDWSLPAGAQQIQVTRLGTAPALVFAGQGRGFVDKKLRNQSRYRYAVAAIDAAGNRAQTLVSAVPTASNLLMPARGERVTAPPLLEWEPVKGAAYYNLQLYRGDRKILSTWPRGTSRQLEQSWRFNGSTRELVPGRYTWYVWPGLGERSERRYGKRLGKSAFRVTK